MQEARVVQKRSQSQKQDGSKQQINNKSNEVEPQFAQADPQIKHAELTRPKLVLSLDPAEPQIMKSSSNQHIVRSSSHVLGGLMQREQPQSAKADSRRTAMILGTTQSHPLNEGLVQAIVDKLGYSATEVRQQVQHAMQTTGPCEHVGASFVANLYFRLASEEQVKQQNLNQNQTQRSLSNALTINAQQVKSLESLGYLSNNNNQHNQHGLAV